MQYPLIRASFPVVFWGGFDHQDLVIDGFQVNWENNYILVIPERREKKRQTKYDALNLLIIIYKNSEKP